MFLPIFSYQTLLMIVNNSTCQHWPLKVCQLIVIDRSSLLSSLSQTIVWKMCSLTVSVRLNLNHDYQSVMLLNKMYFWYMNCTINLRRLASPEYLCSYVHACVHTHVYVHAYVCVSMCVSVHMSGICEHEPCIVSATYRHLCYV